MGLSVLPGLDCFLSQIRDIFSYYIFSMFSDPFSLLTSETPVMWILVCLILLQRSLKLSSFLFILFFFPFSFSDLLLLYRLGHWSFLFIIYLFLIPHFIYCILCLCLVVLYIFNSLLKTFNFSCMFWRFACFEGLHVFFSWVLWLSYH